jgi:AAA domain-containing protein
MERHVNAPIDRGYTVTTHEPKLAKPNGCCETRTLRALAQLSPADEFIAGLITECRHSSSETSIRSVLIKRGLTEEHFERGTGHRGALRFAMEGPHRIEQALHGGSGATYAKIKQLAPLGLSISPARADALVTSIIEHARVRQKGDRVLTYRENNLTTVGSGPDGAVRRDPGLDVAAQPPLKGKPSSCTNGMPNDVVSEPNDAFSQPQNQKLGPQLNSGLWTTRASDVTPKRVDAIWKDANGGIRLARGEHTLIAGEPGLGKSQIAIAMAAACTTGGAWPCGEGRAPVGRVIFLAAEDSVEHTLVPRLIAAGAELDRIYFVEGVVAKDGKGRRTFNFQADYIKLKALVKEIKDVVLVIIDPVTAYMGKIDGHKNTEVRAVLAPLGELAQECKVAIVSITHFNKGTGSA